MASTSRKENQPIYILHSYPFKETSLIVEILSKDFGRIALVAKGARRPKSSLRGMLLPFQSLHATWSGLQDLKTLHNVDWSNAFLAIEGDALVCGFYLNELIMRLVPKDDPYQRQPNICLAIEKLGWTPSIDLNEGLDRTIKYFSDLIINKKK